MAVIHRWRTSRFLLSGVFDSSPQHRQVNFLWSRVYYHGYGCSLQTSKSLLEYVWMYFFLYVQAHIFFSCQQNVFCLFTVYLSNKNKDKCGCNLSFRRGCFSPVFMNSPIPLKNINVCPYLWVQNTQLPFYNKVKKHIEGPVHMSGTSFTAVELRCPQSRALLHVRRSSLFMEGGQI